MSAGVVSQERTLWRSTSQRTLNECHLWHACVCMYMCIYIYIYLYSHLFIYMYLEYTGVNTPTKLQGPAAGPTSRFRNFCAALVHGTAMVEHNF